MAIQPSEANEHPLVSCVVPVYNGARYLAEALDSIIAQGHRPIEIIVVDDGSTDESVSIARRFAEVQCISQPNAGPASARNRGIAEARGSFLAFQDADDLWHREKLVQQLARFAARPELDFCTCLFKNFWTPERAGEAEVYRDPRLDKVSSGFILQTLLARRSAFDRIGPLNPALMTADDSEWFLRAKVMDAVVESMPEVLVYRRLHPDNLTRRLGSMVQQNLLRATYNALRYRQRGEGFAATGPETAGPAKDAVK